MGCHLLKVTEVITEDAFRQFATLSPSTATLPGADVSSSENLSSILDICANRPTHRQTGCSGNPQMFSRLAEYHARRPTEDTPAMVTRAWEYNELLWVRRC